MRLLSSIVLTHLIILMSPAPEAHASKRLRVLEMGGQKIQVDLDEHRISLQEKNRELQDLTAPRFGSDDEWVHAERLIFQNHRLVEIKLWATPQGTSVLRENMWWIVYEFDGGKLTELQRAKIQVHQQGDEPENDDDEDAETGIELKDGKLMFYVDHESVKPQGEL